MMGDSDTSSDSSTASTSTPVLSLYARLIEIKGSAELLKHRIDTIEGLLNQETFDFASTPLRVNKTQHAESVYKLLEDIGIKEQGLTVESFIKELNKYLIHKELVDLNDLQIHLSPLLAAAFQKPIGLKKVPYALLLNSLPSMFY